MTSLAIVIATRNRRDSLLMVLDRLGSQSVRPAFIVVSDSSDNPSDTVTLPPHTEDGLRIHHLHSADASSARQRNEAIAYAVQSGADTIQILDDDTVPESSDFLAHQLQVLESDTGLVGVSGVTKPRPNIAPKRGITRLVFRAVGLYSTRPGRVTRAGIGIPVDLEADALTQTEWLFACSMWKAKIFDVNFFRTDLPGTALGEDVEFSVRAARTGNLVVCPHCVLVDLNAQPGRLTGYLYWYRQVRNRWFIVQAQGRSFGALAYTVSNVALIAMHLLGYIFSGSAGEGRHRLEALRGCVDGFRGAISGSTPR